MYSHIYVSPQWQNLFLNLFIETIVEHLAETVHLLLNYMYLFPPIQVLCSVCFNPIFIKRVTSIESCVNPKQTVIQLYCKFLYFIVPHVTGNLRGCTCGVQKRLKWQEAVFLHKGLVDLINPVYSENPPHLTLAVLMASWALLVITRNP